MGQRGRMRWLVLPLALGLATQAQAQAPQPSPWKYPAGEAPVSAPPPPPPVDPEKAAVPEAQVPASVTPPVAPELPKAFATGFGLSWGGGPGVLSDGRSASLGVALEGQSWYRFNEVFSLRARLVWAFSHFERTAELFATGVRVGAWTAQAYATVTQWLVTGDPAWFLFKFMASVFAYAVLTLGFVAAGLLFLLSPMAATSFLETGFSGGFHLVSGTLDAFLEVGAGSMLYFERSPVRLRAGWGPLLGLALKFEQFGVRVHLVMSPPGLNESRQVVTAAAATLSLSH